MVSHLSAVIIHAGIHSLHPTPRWHETHVQGEIYVYTWVIIFILLMCILYLGVLTPRAFIYFQVLGRTMNKKEINELKIFLKKIFVMSVLMGMTLVIVMFFDTVREG